MRFFTLALFFTATSSLFPQDKSQSDYIKDRIISDLRTIETHYLSRLNTHEYRRAKDLLDDIYVLLDDLTPQDNYAMDEEAFQNFKETIRNEPFRSNRMDIIKSTAEYSSFTVHQVVEILELLTFSDERIQTIRALYPWIIDKSNSMLLFNALEFNSEKEELTKIIEENNGRGTH